MMTIPRRQKDRCDIGQVTFLIEHLMAARVLSSCCAAQEAMLETGRGLERQQSSTGWTRRPLETGAC